MKKHRWIFFVLGFLLLMIFFIGYGYLTEGKGEEEKLAVSVLVYGNDTARWTSMKQGAEQAGQDYGIVLNYVTTSGEDSFTEQVAQMEREIENGADGLMIAACDSTALEEPIAEQVQKIPIVTIETGINHMEQIPYLTTDNREMGKTLAQNLMKEQTPGGKVAVISANMQRNSVNERSQGFLDTLKGYEVALLENTGDSVSEADIRALLKESKADVVVALDNSTLERVVAVVEAEKLDTAVYGVGNTDKVVYYLDQGIINSIVFQNEFSIGYLGVQQLYNEIHHEEGGILPDITFRIVDKSTMYGKENQRLLFPLVQ